MTSRKAAHTSCANGFPTHSRRSGLMVSRPPPATPGLDAWSREFANSLAQKGNGKLTPKQQVAFNDLCATYLKDNANTTKRSGAA
jgi:hypothetical protein